MKNKLQLFSTKEMSQEDWLRFRNRGLGASEIGTVLGLNPYKCSAQLFYEKLNPELSPSLENIAMFMGKEQEDFIANLWQFWEPGGTDAEMMANYRAGKVVRRCQKVNAYVMNPDYPWLFLSLDRKINKRQLSDDAGRLIVNSTDEGALELKTIAGYEANKWEAGIPPAHVVQVQTQIGVCEFGFGELAVFKDGRQFDVYPFDVNAGIFETIVTRTKVFWDKVLEARKIITQKFEAERNFNYKAASDFEAALVELEPAPDGSEAFAKYLKERYKIAEPGEQSGTDEHLAWAERDLHLKGQIDTLETERRQMQNNLKNTLRDGADKITFGPHGYVSWKADVKGVRRYLNNLKKP